MQEEIHDYQNRINGLENFKTNHDNNLISIQVLKARVEEIETKRTDLKLENQQLLKKVRTVVIRFRSEVYLPFKNLGLAERVSIHFCNFSAIFKATRQIFVGQTV